ncbi:MAG: PKD domain-containing protein [Opitutales bacterium]|nr:PKD domain-containing protein [Opitutales bacterium]
MNPIFCKSRLLAAVALFAVGAISPGLAEPVIDVPGWTNHRFGEEVGLLGNRFILFTPEDYDPARRYRVVLHSHGAGGNPESDAAAFLNAFSARGIDDAILMFPHQTASVGEWRYSHPDLPATQDILGHMERVRRDFNVYEKFFFSGFSLGGQFVKSFGMFLSDELIAVAAGGSGGGVNLPNGDYFWQNVLANDLNGSPFNQSGWAVYHPYATLTPPATYKDLPWLIYFGAGETAVRIGGAQRFYDALIAEGADARLFIEEGVGHSISPAMRNQVIDLYIEKVQRENEPPVPAASISRQSGLTVQFDASASTDADGAIVRYEWVFGDGERVPGDIATHPGLRAHSAIATHTFHAPGTYLVRLRVTDNANDMSRLFRALTINNEDFIVSTPPVTHDITVGTTFATEYEFRQSDFASAVEVGGGRSLEKIRITSLPIKGTLRLNGVPVEIEQEVTVAQIPFLAYRSPANDGEDFFEYNAHDGLSWSPFDTSRVTIDIEAAPPSELFTEINPTSGANYGTGTLSVGTLYFTNEQSEISQVPPELDGAPIIRPSSIPDRTSTAAVALTFRITQDATLYVAYDPRPPATSTPPNWLADHWTVETFAVPLRSWFDFRLYRGEFPANSVIELGGNRAAGWSGNNSMYFVIGIPEGAALPTLTEANVEIGEGATAAFTRDFFEERFVPGAGPALSHVLIQRVPFHGRLLLDGAELTAGAQIAPPDLDLLVYEPFAGYTGFDNFVWNANDGEGAAEQPVKVHFTITPSAATGLPILTITRSGESGPRLQWPGRADRRYTLRQGADLGAPASWEVLEVIEGIDGPMERSIALPAEAPDRRFWRIEIEPK